MHSVVDQDSDMAAMFEKTVATPVKYEMLYVGQWKPNLLLADSYGEGRVFMAGDAVHLVIPAGALGMNTGVGDAIDLSWKLAGTLRGWGGPDLLKSYEIERRQVGERNVAASRYAASGRRKWREAWKPDIRDNTPAGAQTRANLAQIAESESRKTYEMVGAELGYRYVDLPLIFAEAGEGPEHDYRTYHPTTWPGARLPHVWLGDGTPMQDRIGDGYTLLQLGGSKDGGGLRQAFADFGAPFTYLDIADAGARDVYGHDFLLLRPDLHVIWRGNKPPADPRKLAAMATGHPDNWSEHDLVRKPVPTFRDHALVDRHIGGADHIAPALDLVLDQGGHAFAAAAHRLHMDRQELRTHVRHPQHLVDRVVERLGDGRRGLRRGGDRVPGSGFEIGNSAFTKGRDVGQRFHPFRGGNPDDARLAGFVLLHRRGHFHEHQIDMAGDQIVHRRRRAAIGHMGEAGCRSGSGTIPPSDARSCRCPATHN